MAAVALSVQHATCLTCVSCVTRRDGQFEVAALGVDVVHAAVNGRIFLYLHEGRLSLFIYFSAAVCLELKRTSVRVHKGYNAYCFVRLCMRLWFALLLAHLVLPRSCCLCSDSRATHRLLLMQLRIARDKRSCSGDALW